jgi:MoaA/NifB/PqqE/SkfB family radical SAM enzyme
LISQTVLKRSVKNITHYIKKEPAFLFTEILLTWHCPQRCLQCNIPEQAVGTRGMAFDKFKHIINSLDSHGTQGLVFSGGDPLLHPKIHTLLDYAGSKNFSHLHMLSTLHGAEKKIRPFIDSLIRNKVSISVSFDGLGSVADKIRGAKDVSKIVMGNMQRLDSANKAAGNPIKTGVNIVISQLNMQQVPEILEKIEQLGWMANIDLYRFSSVNHNDDDSMAIKELGSLQSLIETIKKSPAVITPNWLLDGYVDYLQDKSEKHCPYLSQPALGSKFFIYPNGDVKVCIGEAIGNIFFQTPLEMIRSGKWQEKIEEFKDCSGCWNSCYTPSSNLSGYLNKADLKKVWRILKH